MSDAAAPAAPSTPGATPGVPAISSPRLKSLNEPAPTLVTVNSLADDVWDEIERDGLAENPSKKANREREAAEEQRAPTPPKPKSEPARERDDGPGDDEAEEADPEAGDEQEVSHDEPKDTWGTEKEPYKLTDIPEDKFVKVKVDGEWKVVPMREALAGGIREETFTKRVNQARQVVDEAKSVASQAREREHKLGQNVLGLMNDPQRMFYHLLENHPETLSRVAVQFAHHNRRVKEEPGYGEKVTRAIYEKKLQAQHQAQHQAQQAEQQKQAQAAEQQRIRSELRPGFEAGLKEAGFPKQTPEFQKHLRAMLRNVEDDLQDGERLTAVHVKQAVLDVARFLNLPKGSDARQFSLPRPNGAPPAPAANGQRPPRKKQAPWHGMPQHEKVRSADFLMENTDLTGFVRGRR